MSARAAPAPSAVPEPTADAADAPVDAENVPFLEDFSSPDGVGRFTLDTHFRDPEGVTSGAHADAVWSGDHNMACAGPDTQREVHASNSDEFFWHCAPKGPESGHLMTAMGDIDGYTILSFAPSQSFSGFSRVCWDVNLTDLGGRKWTQAVIIPEEAFLANDERLDYISPVTQDVDETALPLPDGSFMFQLWDHAFRLYNPEQVLEDWQQFSTTDKARRYKHCIVDNGDDTITVTQERDDGVHSQTVPGRFPEEGRVIFQDDNYTPLKDGPIAGFTWHWDNIEIS